MTLPEALAKVSSEMANYVVLKGHTPSYVYMSHELFKALGYPQKLLNVDVNVLSSFDVEQLVFERQRLC